MFLFLLTEVIKPVRILFKTQLNSWFQVFWDESLQVFTFHVSETPFISRADVGGELFDWFLQTV